jgi:hypothetical protein
MVNLPVISRLGEVEAGFGVLLVARLALPRLARAYIARPRRPLRRNALLAKGRVVPPTRHPPVLVRNHPRAPKMIGYE